MPIDQRAAREAYLAAAVARRYHHTGESKVDIAASLGISRFKVARLLDQAHALGLVTVEVRDPADLEDPLAGRVQRQYGVQECIVVRGIGDRDATEAVGAAAARLLEDLLGPDDVLGLPWSRAVHHAVSTVRGLPPIEVVQLCGSLVADGEDTPYDVVRRLGETTGGHTLWYHAPLIMPTAEGAASLGEHEDIARARRAVDRVTVALCSIGAWQENGSTVHDAVTPDEQRAARIHGIVGECMGLVFDRDGRPRHADLSDRLVTLTFDQVHSIGTVIGMARGAARAEATAAALRGGWVGRLIVDEELAEALLVQ